MGVTTDDIAVNVDDEAEEGGRVVWSGSPFLSWVTPAAPPAAVEVVGGGGERSKLS
jgi:hypothetical protein